MQQRHAEYPRVTSAWFKQAVDAEAVFIKGDLPSKAMDEQFQLRLVEEAFEDRLLDALKLL